MKSYHNNEQEGRPLIPTLRTSFAEGESCRPCTYEKGNVTKRFPFLVQHLIFHLYSISSKRKTLFSTSSFFHSYLLFFLLQQISLFTL